jgi:hypothetical protein
MYYFPFFPVVSKLVHLPVGISYGLARRTRHGWPAGSIGPEVLVCSMVCYYSWESEVQNPLVWVLNRGNIVDKILMYTFHISHTPCKGACVSDQQELQLADQRCFSFISFVCTPYRSHEPNLQANNYTNCHFNKVPTDSSLHILYYSHNLFTRFTSSVWWDVEVIMAIPSPGYMRVRPPGNALHFSKALPACAKALHLSIWFATAFQGWWGWPGLEFACDSSYTKTNICTWTLWPRDPESWKLGDMCIQVIGLSDCTLGCQA